MWSRALTPTWHFTKDAEVTLCGRELTDRWIVRDTQDPPDAKAQFCPECAAKLKGAMREIP